MEKEHVHHHEEDHEHEHHGHEHHEHGHEHHHEHEERVHIDHHEGAVIGALKGVIPVADHDEAERLMASAMTGAASRITALGGIIGHIKFVVTAEGLASQLSITDEEVSIRRFESARQRAEGVAIVFSVEDEALEEILEETVGALFEVE